MNLYRFILILSLISSLCSCTSKKILVDHVRLKHISEKNLKDSIATYSPDFAWLRSKGSADILFPGEDHTLKFNFRCRKDSAVWIHISKGVPILTAVISQDSVQFLKKIGEKEYFLGDYGILSELFHVDLDYEILQDFIIGNPIAFEPEANYKLRIDSNLYYLSSNKPAKMERMLKKHKSGKNDMLYQCWFEPKNYKCKRVLINMIEENIELEVVYDAWDNIDGEILPLLATIKLRTEKGETSLKLDYNDKIKLNEPQTMPFKITDAYEPYFRDKN